MGILTSTCDYGPRSGAPVERCRRGRGDPSVPSRPVRTLRATANHCTIRAYCAGLEDGRRPDSNPRPGEGLHDAGSRGAREGAPARPHVALDRRGFVLVVAAAAVAYGIGKSSTVRSTRAPAAPRRRRCKTVAAPSPSSPTSSRLGHHRRGLQRRHQHHLLVPGLARVDRRRRSRPRSRARGSKPSPTTIRYDLAAPLIPSASEVVTIPGGTHGHKGQGRRHASRRVVVQLHRGRRQTSFASRSCWRSSTTSRCRSRPAAPCAPAATGRGPADVGDLRLALADASGRLDVAVDPGRRDRHHQGRGRDVREPERPDGRRPGRAQGVEHAVGRCRREQGRLGALHLCAGLQGPAGEPDAVQQRRGPVHRHPRQHGRPGSGHG